MLHHISVAVNNPIHVAEVLAEVLRGSVLPFPPNPGSYIVLAGDEFGTLIELYPFGTEVIPGAWQDQAGFRLNEQSPYYTAVHAALSVPADLEEIQQIGAREGWRVVVADRDGLFDVVEFWVENRLMLELLTPAMTPKYLNMFKPEQLKAALAQFAMAESRR